MNSSERPSRLASRMAEIEPFHVVALVTRAQALQAQGRGIVGMVVGEPDFPTPAPIVEAGMRALRENKIRYTGAMGSSALREAISDWYATRYQAKVPPGRIGVTTGSSAALLLTMGVLLSPGDEVLMTDPGYPCNRHFVRAMEGRAVCIPVGPGTAYQLTAELVEQHWTPRTVAVMVASPSNPTGTMIPQDEMRRIHAVVAARGGRLIVDEIYHGLTYGEDAHSVLEFADDVFVINSFSKYFCMTGWRLGWLVAPVPYLEALEKLAQNLFISSPDIAQQAALAAFHPDTLKEAERNRAAFQSQRDFLLPAVRALGFEVPVTPRGAFYLYANAARHTQDSYRFCLDLLERTGVAIAPGVDFGHHRAAEHVRFSYPKPIAVLEEGVRRIEAYLK
ncbi:MAG: pyridoxal phosphate-dependent aminotransferase [Betaproteobacteria bacterium]|nr:pyridoxal phosphate-dependent aminotransferase [Betaproteobacteria bacterium]